MREIKFRAWDDTEGILSNVDTISFIGGGTHVYMPGVGEGWAHVNKEFEGKLKKTITLEQFTGLIDKNGKEIYEGDIVSFSEYDHRGVAQFARGVFGVNWDYSKNTDPEWKDGNLYGGWGHLHNLRDFADDILKEIIVIGNIHETPELVNG